MSNEAIPLRLPHSLRSFAMTRRKIMKDCIFCKIVSGELPSHKVYEDEETLAFLDIMPNNPGHTLVIPKKHYQNYEAIPDELLAKVILVTKKVGKSLKDGLGAKGYNVCQNNDPESGQVVPHLHFHVIPRIEGDGFKFWPQKPYPEGEDLKVLEKIKIK